MVEGKGGGGKGWWRKRVVEGAGGEGKGWWVVEGRGGEGKEWWRERVEEGISGGERTWRSEGWGREGRATRNRVRKLHGYDR